MQTQNYSPNADKQHKILAYFTLTCVIEEQVRLPVVLNFFHYLGLFTLLSDFLELLHARA